MRIHVFPHCRDLSSSQRAARAFPHERIFRHLAETRPIALAAPKRSSRFPMQTRPCRGGVGGPRHAETKPTVSQTSPPALRRSRSLPPRRNEAHDFPDKPARSEAKPIAPTTPKRSPWCPNQYRPRRGEADGPRQVEAKPGFPGRPVRDARSAEWELTSALSLAPNVRGRRFQMRQYRDCERDPLKS